MKKFFAVLFFVLVVSAFFVAPVFAQGFAQVAQPFDLTGLLKAAGEFVLGSAVIAASATFLVNTAKSAGFVTDSESVTWVSTINFVLIIGVFFVKLFAPTFDLGVVEKVADGIVRQGPGFIVPLMPLLVAFSKWVHGAVKGTKLIGTSYSLKAAKK